MGIFFTHTEDNKYHIYKLRSRGLVYSFIILGLLALFLFYYFYKVQSNITIAGIWAIILILVMIIPSLDFFPIRARKLGARGRGNQIIEKGNPLAGELYEIKIEKKRLL